MKTCATCLHFHKQTTPSVRTGEFVTGTCHATPPVRDWTWHRTRSHDYCWHHSDNVAPQFATGTTGPAPLAATKAAAAPSTDQTADAPTRSTRRSSKPARGELFPTG